MGCVEPLHQFGEALGQRFVDQCIVKCPQLHPDGGVSDRFGLRNFSVRWLLVCSFIAAIIFGVIFGSHRVGMLSGQKSSLQWDRFLRLTPIAHACLTVVGTSLLGEATEGDFTAKDFRTWAATVLAAVEFCQIGPADSDTAGRRNVASAVRSVARRLGNTPAVCRSSYIHPEILASYADGTLLALVHKLEDPDLEDATGLFESERSVRRFLRRRLKQQEMRPQPTLSPPRLADAVSASLSPQL